MGLYRSIKSSLLGYVLAWFFLSSLSGTGHVLDLQILDGYQVVTTDKISSSLFYPVPSSIRLSGGELSYLELGSIQLTLSVAPEIE